MQAKGPTARVNLNRDVIDKIKPPVAGRINVFDAKVPGLCVRVTAAGSKSLYWFRKVDGKPERIKLGTWGRDITSIEEARRIAASHNGKKADGLNPAAKIRTKRTAPTLGEVFDLFIELPTRTKAKRPKSAVTLKGYNQQFNACLDHWRNRKLSAISSADIEKLHNTLATERGPYMANRVLGLLKSLFNCAIHQGMFDANPAARLQGFEEPSRDRFLHADELPKFWKALEAEPSDKVRDFIKMALFTGQRRMNCLQMKWADIDFQAAMWNIPATKTGKHSVPLTAEALKILKARKASGGDSEYVFPGRHGHGHLQDPMRQWREILARAGIADLHIHDLRRSMGSWQATTGASLTVIGKTLGHTRPETTAIYSRLETSPVRTAMETATAAILAAAKPTKTKGARRGKAKAK